MTASDKRNTVYESKWPENEMDTLCCIRLSEIQNGFPGPKPFSSTLAYLCNVKFSQNLPEQTKFYKTCPSVLQILESLVPTAI